MTQAWIVRAGRNDEYEDVAFSEDLIAVGWRQVGDLSEQTKISDIRRLVAEAYRSVQPQTRDTYAPQLWALRSSMRRGDLVVLLRARAPEVAVGEIVGDYVYRPDLPASHTRPVRWLRRDVRLSEIGADLATAPALTAIYRISRPDATDRLLSVSGSVAPADLPPPGRNAKVSEVSGEFRAADNLRRNLSYARSLATAGSHLERLGVTGFEVKDVYRAAWVQAVAALDHWVRQEIHERMLAMVGDPSRTRPESYRRFELPLEAVEDVQAGKRTLHDAVDGHLRSTLAFATYQNPDKIRDGLRLVADVSNLWQRVATVLSERSGDSSTFTGAEIRRRLGDAVRRRNKIAHEYDEDPAQSPAKRDIDAASTMQTIDWIDQVVEAILIVLDQG
ncbi:hypothetical protein RB614_29010 [Phytohabitans sp. ZYX-F-186]|uniref:Restriction system protein n=1 Tax=Phytohabitans maris TaxID=3071409 RepID=A0ABU0ZNG6_9ACTN|nr:hypothetical protein [Phytohabitans sp. ZYX-F-186]MDQ7908578.1 hypothetical protein [Phytohabitans sp. ZYX-F-186]